MAKSSTARSKPAGWFVAYLTGDLLMGIGIFRRCHTLKVGGIGIDDGLATPAVPGRVWDARHCSWRCS